MNTFQSSWDDYLRKCYPEGMLPEQHKQVYRAFFAGALVALNSCVALAYLSNEDAEKQLQALLDEATKACEEQVEVAKARN